MIEGDGVIVNQKIMSAYFALDGAKAASLDGISNFSKLKEVVEDMQARKADLGIDGVFASTSLLPGEDWRWQTHLSNIPFYYESHTNNVDLSGLANTSTITFQYGDNFRNIFDPYLNNSTIAPTMAGSKTVDDSMAEFALGKARVLNELGFIVPFDSFGENDKPSDPPRAASYDVVEQERNKQCAVELHGLPEPEIQRPVRREPSSLRAGTNELGNRKSGSFLTGRHKALRRNPCGIAARSIIIETKGDLRDAKESCQIFPVVRVADLCRFLNSLSYSLYHGAWTFLLRFHNSL